MRLYIFSLLIAAAAAQSVNPTPSPAEPPKKARLEGAVVSLTGEAIPRAALRLSGGALPASQMLTGISVTADEVGKFVIEDVTPGANYRLSAQRPGYVSAQYGARSASGPGTPLTLADGQVLKGLTITMTPQGTISGKITDRDNDPIQGGLVSAVRVGYQGGVRALLPGGTGKTDDKGEYRIANVVPGRYYLAVVDRQTKQGLDNFLNGVVDGSKTVEVNAITYYPNVAGFLNAAPVNVIPGEDLRGMDIRMRASRTFAIRGKAVNSSTGAPASGLLLRAAPKQPDGQPLDILSSLAILTTHAAQDGTFEMSNAMVGDWTISAIGSLPALGTTTPYNLYGTASVSVRDADLTGVVLQVDPGASVSGSLRFEGGDFKTVFAPPPPDAVSLALAGTGAAGAALLAGRPLVALTDIGSGGGLQSAQVNEDGTFKFGSANRGRYALSVVRVPPKYYVKSVHLGSSDVTHSVLDLSGEGGSIDILLGDNPGELNGSLRNDKNESMAGVLVVLWSKEPEVASSTNGVNTAYTDQNGTFQFKSLAPGEYYVAAWEDADAQQVQNRDLLAMFSDDDAKIKLAEGAKQSMEAKLITAEKLAAAVAKLP
jgi:hypothetical protein